MEKVGKFSVPCPKRNHRINIAICRRTCNLHDECQEREDAEMKFLHTNGEIKYVKSVRRGAIS